MLHADYSLAAVGSHNVNFAHVTTPDYIVDRVTICLTVRFLKPGLTDNPKSFLDNINKVVRSYISCVNYC